MREIIRICDKAGIVCGTGTAAMIPGFFDKLGERDTAFLTHGVGRASFAGWQAWNLAFGDSVSNQRIAEVERMLRNEMAFKWFSIQRVGGRVMFIMTLKVSRKAYNVAPPNSGPTPTPTSDEWLWFQMPSGGTVTLTRTGSPTAVTLEVSLDNGQTWTTWTESGTTRTQTLAAGQVMHVRNASATQTGFSTSLSSYYTFSFDQPCESGGNVNSLLCKNTENVILQNLNFAFLFYNSVNLTKGPTLPSLDVPDYAYAYMFNGCTGLQTAPIISATSCGSYACRNMFWGCTSLAESPYLHVIAPGDRGFFKMFQGCTSLVKITTDMTDISATNCINEWVYQINTIGDFYCPQTLTIPTGISGIPTGWTRHDL